MYGVSEHRHQLKLEHVVDPLTLTASGRLTYIVHRSPSYENLKTTSGTGGARPESTADVSGLMLPEAEHMGAPHQLEPPNYARTDGQPRRDLEEQRQKPVELPVEQCPRDGSGHEPQEWTEAGYDTVTDRWCPLSPMSMYRICVAPLQPSRPRSIWMSASLPTQAR